MRITLATLLSAIALASALPTLEQTPDKNPGEASERQLVVVEDPGCKYKCEDEICVQCKKDEDCPGGCNKAVGQVCLFKSYRTFDYAVDCVEKTDARCAQNDKRYCAEKPKDGTAFNFGYTPKHSP